MTRRSSLTERRRVCPVCGGTFYAAKPSRPQKYCSHACAFVVIGDTVRAAALTPEAREKQATTVRGRGSGPYVKRGGRHEHRVLAEEALGRSLDAEEIVTINQAVYPSRSAYAVAQGLGRKVHP